MDHKKAPSPFAVLWGWASGEHGGFYASVALAVLGVACGMVPYFCAMYPATASVLPVAE